MSAGWQSNSGLALWSATQSEKCDWCEHTDTHTHQLLHCQAFKNVREQHTDAVTYMQNNPRTCWFPLPVHSPNIALLKQAMHLRIHTAYNHALDSIQAGTVFYTDGSCDAPTDPYAARAAWAVVIRQPKPEDPTTYTLTVTANDHCPGHQTINRAELFAFLIATEQIRFTIGQTPAQICTDSQFVMGIVQAIESRTIHVHPHKRAHWDLIRQLMHLWDPQQMSVIKIASHRKYEDARSQEDLWHIKGNECADKAAVQCRKTDLPEFDQLCQEVQTHYREQHKVTMQILEYLHALACVRMSLIDEKKGQTSREARASNSNLENPFRNHIDRLANWHHQGSLFTYPPEPHRVVFWSSTWGTNITRLVWLFCMQIQWPCPDAPRLADDPGITWTELTLAFMFWSGQHLPIKIREGKVWNAYSLQDDKVKILPLKSRSLRVVSESFRYMVKHIQTFSATKIMPVYKQQGATSLTRLGFAMDHRSGISRRPSIPHAIAVNNWLEKIMLTLPHNPPYCTDLEIPVIPTGHDIPAWPAWPEIVLHKREAFARSVRNHMARKKAFDLIHHPGVN